MKLSLPLLFFILSFTFVRAQDKSKITDVTVYLDGAEINRMAEVSLKAGTTELKFKGLSPHIEESSIQISGLKTASIISINYGINHISKRKQNDSISALKDQLKAIENKIQFENNLIAGYNEETSLIKNNNRLGNETEVVSLEQLKSFAKYYRTRITQLKIDTHKANTQIEKFKMDQQDVKKQLVELNVDDKVQTGEIILKLTTDKPSKLDLKISYNIRNAGWFPIYDLKAEEINSPISLQYKAHVYQSSGCNWENVNLVLSTSDPNTNNEKPIVNPKYLNFISPYSNYKSQRAIKSYDYKYNPLVKTVSGVLTSASDGLPLPGASVIEKGTSNGVQTDFDGKYSLRTNGGERLVYSYVGMKTEELPIHSSIINVALEEDTALDEVVIIGYGTKTNAEKALRGKVAGLSGKRNSGQPGANTSVQLRGIASINGNTEPLFIIDGVPVREDAFRSLNENDIASIDVLKDVSATSVYGNKGSNGVIVIKTKKGTNLRTNSLGVNVEKELTNTRFKIDRTYSIPSDGDVTVIEIDKFSVPANYKYFAAPVLNENVFLTAKIGNWEQYNLLPAEANVYFEGSYSGKTNINPGATTDSLTISLGVDPNIIVKHTQHNDFKKSTFIGNNKVIYKGFDIEIRNNKTSDIQLTLVDRIPITQNKSIKIDDIETGNSNYNEDKGLLKWLINLKPGETNKVKHSYSIKYPKGKRINL